MLKEDKKIFIEAEHLFPEAARRVKILEALKNSWATLFKNGVGRHSYPYNLGINEIFIFVDNRNAENMIRKSRGNVLQALKRLDYELPKNFELKFIYKIPAKIRESEAKRESFPEVKITEEELRIKMQGAPESLPEEINQAVSHLKIFLEKRFPSKNRTYSNNPQ